MQWVHGDGTVSRCLKTWLGGCQWGVLGSQCGLLLLGRRAGKGSTEDTVPGRPHHTDGEACVTESTGHCGGRAHPGQKGQLWLDLSIFPSPPHLPWMGCLPGKPQWPYLLLLRGGWDYGLGNTSNLEADTGKQILRTYCNIPEPRRGWGPRECVRACVRACVCVCVCMRTCTCVLLGSALSFLSSLLGLH